MRVLITGGFGYVGGRVATHLQQAGHHVILGSRTSRRMPVWLPKAEVVQTDWNDARALEKICAEVDVVIHAAGMNVQECAADPLAALEINGLATARLVAAASRSGVDRLIYLSTAHVYANPLIGTITEETCPRNLHPYATSHLAGENAALGARQRGEIESFVLRLSNAFGAPVHKDANCWMLLVNDLCRQAVESGKMILSSSGLQQRDFIPLASVCQAVERLSSCDLKRPLPAVVNIGSGVSQTVFEMAKLVRHRCQLILGFEPDLHRLEPAADESHGTLAFRSAGMEAIDECVSNDTNTEIDGLLLFCRASSNRYLSDSI
jgi:UDP-glucose 4-epimerase